MCKYYKEYASQTDWLFVLNSPFCPFRGHRVYAQNLLIFRFSSEKNKSPTIYRSIKTSTIFKTIKPVTPGDD